VFGNSYTLSTSSPALRGSCEPHLTDEEAATWVKCLGQGHREKVLELVLESGSA
jgi:hypothetical protein